MFLLLASVCFCAGCDNISDSTPTPLKAQPQDVSPTAQNVGHSSIAAASPTPQIQSQRTNSASLPVMQAIPSPTKTPSVILFREITDMTFSDATHGWVLGPECDDNHKCGSAIRATTDGGVTWQRLALPTPNPQLSKSEATHHAATHIRFLDDKNGWLYGPGLFSTTDSGKTWTDETLANDIVLMEAKQDTVWAIENQCAATNPYDCNLRLLNLDSSNHTWKYLPSEPALKQAYAFAHPTPKDAWIASPDLLGNKPGTLIVTHNAGKTWRTLPLPCTTLNLDHLAALGDGELWYFCASEASAGQQSKEIYYSSDDGSTWRRIADSSRDGLGNLSIGGYLEYFTTSEPHHIWALYQREFVYESKDAGTTWTYVPAYIGFNDSPKGPILFIDPSHGWIGSYNGINRTTDGGATWKIYVIDPGQYPSLGG